EKTKELSRKFVDLNNVLDTNILNKPIISDLMWKVRNLSVLERKNYYLTYRIDDQKKWYSNKASFNKKRYKQWFFVIITSQALAMISVVFLIRFPASNWNLLGFFTTLASSTISWLQLKRHQELKQAYTTTAQELNFIEALSNQVNTDEELSKFVLDSENAISREHTLWLAQRRG
ncbi:MAG: hypothetical protein JWN60_352, partial [Acidobacteria bacterium]|nr:hypothetical protein [Acidobacteriota bacterium]